MQEEFKNEKIWYLCDGNKKGCRKITCHKNKKTGIICKHTSDIRYAKNFIKTEYGSIVSYKEKEEPCKETLIQRLKKLFGNY